VSPGGGNRAFDVVYGLAEGDCSRPDRVKPHVEQEPSARVTAVSLADHRSLELLVKRIKPAVVRAAAGGEEPRGCADEPTRNAKPPRALQELAPIDSLHSLSNVLLRRQRDTGARMDALIRGADWALSGTSEPDPIQALPAEAMEEVA
jgi:hypothetical protein